MVIALAIISVLIKKEDILITSPMSCHENNSFMGIKSLLYAISMIYSLKENIIIAINITKGIILI